MVDDPVRSEAAGPVGFLFTRVPWACRLWVTSAVVAALGLPWLLRPYGQEPRPAIEALTGLTLVGLSILNVEIGRLLEGGVSATQRPHKALSAWSFASALLLPTWWLLPVVAVSYTHAWWRGLRVPVWKWVGSAGYVVLAGVAAAMTAHAVGGGEQNFMHGSGLRGLVAVVAAAAAFLAVETLMFHGSAYLNHAEDEAWLRQTLRGSSFYLTETGVLLVGGLSAAIWTGGPWFVLLLLPVYALTQRAALHEPLRERAEHDEKTGLLRFDPWLRQATLRAERCGRAGQPWSVLFADLDHFKRFNTTWGHLAGDQALVGVARALRSELREGDLLCRFGGEEFCVFLPAIPADDLTGIAERLRTAVSLLELPGQQQVTISVGVAAVVPATEQVDFGAAFAAADKALFEAKAAGRNAVRVHVMGRAPTR